MAFRCPNPIGLAVPPDAPGDADNPAADEGEVGVETWWGRWALYDSLPNASSAPATGAAFAAMRPGDLAYAQDLDEVLELSSRGTDGGGDAIWRTRVSDSKNYARRLLYSVGV